MRLRGDIFWEWADPELHCRTHDELLMMGLTSTYKSGFRAPAKRKFSSEFMPPMAWLCMKWRLTHTLANR
ncbi:hypothetical protein D3C85_713310 [compost metagenome]